jgi:hypothetical protein
MRESYKEDRVKNGVFQAMMEVELKNDGPVGVDYTSEDAVVTIYLLSFWLLPASPWNWRTNRDYRSRSKSIRISLRKNRRSPNRPKMRIRTRIAVQARRLSSRFPQNCWHKEKDVMNDEEMPK